MRTIIHTLSKRAFLLAAFLVAAASLMAQTLTVKGTVKDEMAVSSAPA